MLIALTLVGMQQLMQKKMVHDAGYGSHHYLLLDVFVVLFNVNMVALGFANYEDFYGLILCLRLVQSSASRSSQPA